MLEVIVFTLVLFTGLYFIWRGERKNRKLRLLKCSSMNTKKKYQNEIHPFPLLNRTPIILRTATLLPTVKAVP